MNPDELLFAKTHEWLKVADDGSGGQIGTIGISAFAVAELTDLVFIDLPQVGAQVSAGEAFGEVESVKAVSDLYSPIAGAIVEVNGEIADHLERLNEDPYGSGWLLKVKLAEGQELDHLMDHAAYQRQCAEEG